MCMTVHWRLATVSGCLFLLQESWNQGGRGGGRSNPSEDPTPTRLVMAQCRGPCSLTGYSDASNPHSEHTRRYQPPSKAWHNVSVATFCRAWGGYTRRNAATASVSNPASPTTWPIAILARDELHLDGADVTWTRWLGLAYIWSSMWIHGVKIKHGGCWFSCRYSTVHAKAMVGRQEAWPAGRFWWGALEVPPLLPPPAQT